jgi:hypothetical protein
MICFPVPTVKFSLCTPGSVAVPMFVDFLLPEPAFPYFSRTWYNITASHLGMSTYLPSKLSSDFVPEKDTNYLVCASPHGVWKFGYFHFANDMVSKYGSVYQIKGLKLRAQLLIQPLL